MHSFFQNICSLKLFQNKMPTTNLNKLRSTGTNYSEKTIVAWKSHVGLMLKHLKVRTRIPHSFHLLKCTKIGHNFDEKNSGVHVWSRGKKNGSKPLWCLLQIPVMDVAEFEPWSGSNIFSNRDKCRLTAAKYRFGYFGGKVSNLFIQVGYSSNERPKGEEQLWGITQKIQWFPNNAGKWILFVFFFIDFLFSRKKQVIDEYAIPILKETFDLYKKVF